MSLFDPLGESLKCYETLGEPSDETLVDCSAEFDCCGKLTQQGNLNCLRNDRKFCIFTVNFITTSEIVSTNTAFSTRLLEKFPIQYLAA